MTSFRLLTLIPLSLTVLLSCGDRGAPPALVATENGEKAKPSAPGDVPADEKQLAELDRQIDAKEKELAELKNKAEALRRKIAAGKKPVAGKAYTSAEQLLVGMPPDKHPKSGEDAAPERRAANQWLKENVLGKTVEWTSTVGDVRLEEAEGNRYTAAIDLDHHKHVRFGADNGIAFGGIKLGKAFALAALTDDGPDQSPPKLGSADNGPYLYWGKVDERLAKKLRDLKGTKVTFRATILKAEFWDVQSIERPDSKVRAALTLRIVVQRVSTVALE
jgi:hypothetical protein